MITAIVLAGGKSERMGSPKALLDFDGRLCIDLVIAACRRAGVDEVIVVLGHRADETAKVLGPQVRTVVNANYESGQTSSFKTGVAHLPDECDGFLLFPVDFPLVSDKDVSLLLNAFCKRDEGAKVFIPSHSNKRGHPVLLDGGLRDEIMSLGDDEPARNIILRDDSRIHYVNVKNPGVFEDMDSIEDYRRLLALYREMHINERKHPPSDSRTF